jgi:hypothetical protein
MLLAMPTFVLESATHAGHLHHGLLEQQGTVTCNESDTNHLHATLDYDLTADQQYDGKSALTQPHCGYACMAVAVLPGGLLIESPTPQAFLSVPETRRVGADLTVIRRPPRFSILA